MKILSSAILAARQSRAGTLVHGLIYVTAKTRDTGVPAPVGFWTGEDHQAFTINSVSRTYYGAGAALDLGETVSEVGIVIRTRTVRLSGLAPKVLDMAKAYEARLAPVEIHRAEFDPLTNALIDAPERVFKGWVDQIQWTQNAETVECVMTLASIARALTRTQTQKYSDASQRLRDVNDAFFQYVDVSGTTDVYWGEKRVGGTPGGTVGNLVQKVTNR